jgi:hypothetical protein
MRNPGLLHDSVGRMAGQNFAIDREISFGRWAEPNLMISFTGADEMAAMLLQHSFHFWREGTGHSAA